MTYLLILALCVASALLGRLLLTRDQAWRTITVRLPALFMLAVSTVLAITFWTLFGIACFIGGSFYGLGQWWWPQLFQVLEFNGTFLGPVVTGKWDQ
jgi:Na+-driven multidrug efflux pump